MDALGRFYSNTSGGHSYGPSVFKVGVDEAWAQNDFIKERFVAREGEYDWSNSSPLADGNGEWFGGLPMSSHVVALAGPRGCGKSTIAQHLVEQHGFERLAFSDVLRELQCWRVQNGLMIDNIFQTSDKCCDAYDPRFLLKAMEEKTQSRNKDRD